MSDMSQEDFITKLEELLQAYTPVEGSAMLQSWCIVVEYYNPDSADEAKNGYWFRKAQDRFSPPWKIDGMLSYAIEFDGEGILEEED